MPTIIFKKLESQLIELFRILKRIDRLAYRLELFINIRIYNVIFIAHLKLTIDSVENLYRRRRLSTSTVIVDDEEE